MAGSIVKPWRDAIRPHQWVKNLLIFVPMILSHKWEYLPDALLAFFAFCAVASSVYIINDISDMDSDRAHPRKRRRPFASGILKPRTGWMVSSILIAIPFSILLYIDADNIAMTLLTYLLFSTLYTFWIKKKVLLDIVGLGSLYTLRLVSGSVAIGVELSPWLLGFSMFIFLSLAAMKRQAELIDARNTDRKEISGRGYSIVDIPVINSISVSAGNASILVFALYLNSDAIQTLYSSPEVLWLICPILIYWINRLAIITHRGEMTDDPIVYAARDRASILAGAVCVIFLAAASAF